MSAVNSSTRRLKSEIRNPKSEGPQANPVTSSRRRRWVLRLAALLMGPLVVLAGLEGALRLGGYGFSTSLFKKATIGGEQCLVENDEFGLRFFPRALARMPAATVMRANKPAGALRVFILGESAALGDPRPQFGAGRYLEVLLRERFPGQDFEVVNTGIIAINSHVILPIARECARRQGDVWIIYMGNNEMVGPFGAATVFGRQAPALSVVRLTLGIQRARLGQLLVDLVRRLKGPSTDAAWHGLEMFQNNIVPPDDPRREVVYHSFARNLEDILEAGINSGARVLLSTVAVNLKDCPPFASELGGHIKPAERAAYEKLCAEASAAEAQGNLARAAQAYEEAGRLCPRSAELQFRLGACQQRLGNTAAARRAFESAVDCDALPCRADSRINGIISEAGRRFAGSRAGSGFAFCDAVSALAQDSRAGTPPSGGSILRPAADSQAGIPGQESFYEHVHLNFEGNYRLARAWAAGLEKLLSPATAGRATGGWASQETCERLLGLTDWNRLSVFDEIARRLKQPPFAGQLDNKRRLEAAQAAVGELQRRIAAGSPAEACEVYLEAIRRAPRDHNLEENYAEFLEATHDAAQAIIERQKVRDMIPHFYFSHYSLGRLLKEQGRLPEALECLEKAALLNPRGSEVRLELGMVLARQMKWAAALDQFSLARQFNPEDPQALLYSGEVLWKLDRRAESLDSLRQAIRIQPACWEAHYRLGDELSTEGQTAAAAEQFEQVLACNPSYLKARINLGVALFNLGRPLEAARQFDEALRLDPGNTQAADFKRKTAAYMAARGHAP
jgi:tetratricopeptide (TPR) repeat protein